VGFLRHKTTSILQKKGLFFNKPSAVICCAGQTYPSQVAPQQSLFPFRFDDAKLQILYEQKTESKKYSLPFVHLTKMNIF
jgi:hypothetical protein